MKPKEYVKQFSPWNRTFHDSFVNSFKRDVVTAFEVSFLISGRKLSLSRAQSLTQEAKDKFERIRALIPEIPENIWGFVYASLIKPMKDEMCAEEIKRKQEKRRRHEEFENHMNNMFFESILGSIFSSINQVDEEAASFMGLTPPFSQSDVQNAYRSLSKKLHPDSGGSHKDFLVLVEMKNRALSCAST